VLYIRCDDEVKGSNWAEYMGHKCEMRYPYKNLDGIENFKVNDHLGHGNVDERTKQGVIGDRV
jgi:hypothetical protein